MTRLLAGTLLGATAVLTAACRATPTLVDNLTASWLLTPATPLVGQPATADLTLRQPDGRPVLDAHLTLEAHMIHPGMAPAVVTLAGVGDGRYRAGVILTMSGDWVMFVSGQLGDGRRVRQRVARVAAQTAP